MLSRKKCQALVVLCCVGWLERAEKHLFGDFNCCFEYSMKLRKYQKY